jgi:hypothetical protein
MAVAWISCWMTCKVCDVIDLTGKRLASLNASPACCCVCVVAVANATAAWQLHLVPAAAALQLQENVKQISHILDDCVQVDLREACWHHCWCAGAGLR